MEVMFTARYLRGFHLLITDGAHIVEIPQLVLASFRQAVDLIDGRAPFHEDGPTGSRVAPDVEVGVDAHHHGPDGAAALEDQDPRAVEEEEDAETEFDGVAERSDVVDVIVQAFPERVSAGVQEEQGIYAEGDGYFYDDLDAERGNRQ